MTWKSAVMQLGNGESFEIVHKLEDKDLEEAFDYWTLWATELTRQSLIDFVNKSGIIYAMTPEKYKAIIDGDVIEITDSTPMPFGKHQGKRMIDVPAIYLIYIYDKGWINHNGVKQYIIENMAALKLEASKTKR
jgi:uncharacterized protein (DUF3820 family)